LSVKGVGDAFASFGFSVPIPAVNYVFSGFEFLGIILVTAIPFGIYDLVEAMDNVESAEAAGASGVTKRKRELALAMRPRQRRVRRAW
jgi:AGZA family xanthine/uracil permease-like MFS transporter